MLQHLPDDIVSSLILSTLPLSRCRAAAIACRSLTECAREPLALLSAVCTIRRWRAARLERLLLSLETVYAVGNRSNRALTMRTSHALARRVRTLRARLLRLAGREAVVRFDARMRRRYAW